MKKELWHDIILTVITMVALMASPTAFYLALVKHPAWLAVTIIGSIYLFFFEMANSGVRRKE